VHSSRTCHVVAPTPRFCGNQKNVARPFPALAPQGVKKCPTERDQVPGTPFGLVVHDCWWEGPVPARNRRLFPSGA